MGRKRSRAPSTAGATISIPPARLWRAYSTTRIAFLLPSAMNVFGTRAVIRQCLCVHLENMSKLGELGRVVRPDDLVNSSAGPNLLPKHSHAAPAASLALRFRNLFLSVGAPAPRGRRIYFLRWRWRWLVGIGGARWRSPPLS